MGWIMQNNNRWSIDRLIFSLILIQIIMQSKGKIMLSVFFQFPRSAKSRIGLTFFVCSQGFRGQRMFRRSQSTRTWMGCQASWWLTFNVSLPASRYINRLRIPRWSWMWITWQRWEPAKIFRPKFAWGCPPVVSGGIHCHHFCLVGDWETVS
jgi:hypothetical protein